MDGNLVLYCYLLVLASGFRLAEQHPQLQVLPQLQQQFYYPTDEGIKEFQQILLKGLGLSAVPDLSQLNETSLEEYQPEVLVGEEEADPEPEASNQRETIIIHHDPVKSRVIRRGGGKERRQQEWKLRFRPLPAGSRSRSDSVFHWQPDSLHPLQLLWFNQHNTSAHFQQEEVGTRSGGSGRKNAEEESQLRLIVDNHVDPAVGIDIQKDLYHINSTPLSQFAPEVEETISRWASRSKRRKRSASGASVPEELDVTIRCLGQQCHRLRQRKLGGRMQFTDWSSPIRSPRSVHPSAESRSKMRKKKNRKHNDLRRYFPELRNTRNKNEEEEEEEETGKRKNDCSAGSRKRKGCCPRSLTINLRNMTEFSWIVEPKEINIYVCKGQCRYPELAHNSVSNHALFQGYLHSIRQAEAPKLCCTPSKLDSIDIVYRNLHGKLIRTTWDNAIVKECTCA